ncbi:hypothetical protein EYZ11_011227 [Aspergillus tanneri]|uniref:Uncharacterized protein n=1 Tax=Aspergillus tanneri TaxID=1220188 RepID=A0A4V3UN04_9EURO|nr:hypothetical protein EYZ11_011227 [Aspergillus tanneri]
MDKEVHDDILGDVKDFLNEDTQKCCRNASFHELCDR